MLELNFPSPLSNQPGKYLTYLTAMTSHSPLSFTPPPIHFLLIKLNKTHSIYSLLIPIPLNCIPLTQKHPLPMASFPPLTSKSFLFFCLFFISTFAISASAFQFQVGGKQGWTKPSAKHSHSYNDWAAENRFQIGDTLCKYIHLNA